MVEPARAASKISLVLADVDGTLVTEEKVLTSRARAAVKALQDAGIGFAITSGRPPRGMAMLVDPLALRTPVAAFNGGIFVKDDMTIMEEHVLAADAAKRAVEVILRNRMDVWVYSGKDWLVRDRQCAARRAGAMDRQVRPDRRREFRRRARPRRQDRGRKRRSRPGRAVRKGCPGRARRGRVGGPFAALLSRRHPSGRQQGDRRHDTVEIPRRADRARSPRSATCRTTC